MLSGYSRIVSRTSSSPKTHSLWKGAGHRGPVLEPEEGGPPLGEAVEGLIDEEDFVEAVFGDG
jgi:hypothetical protein